MNAMISSILDLIVSDLPERTVHMTSGCPYGEDNALTEIGDGTEVTLVYGRYSANAVIRFRSGGECFHGSFELGSPLAKQLRLLGDRRYKLVYDPERKMLRIASNPISVASAAVGGNAKLGARRLWIGYGLLSQLGLPDDGRAHTLTVRHGGHSERLAVRSPANLFEGGLQLHPSALRALSLQTGSAYRLSYDQRARELVLTKVNGRTARDGPGKGKDHRSKGANRSAGAQHTGQSNRSPGAGASPPASPTRVPQRSQTRTRRTAPAARLRTNRLQPAEASKRVVPASLKPAPPVYRAARQGMASRHEPDGRGSAAAPYMPKGRA